MKILPSKKIHKISLLIAFGIAVTATTGVVAIGSQQRTDEVAVKKDMFTKKKEPTTVIVDQSDVPVEEAEKPIEDAPIADTPVANTEPIAAQAPAPILSTQEYAEKYLDMKALWAQKCLDLITSEWPERFTPEVRERNIKALSIFANVCATGIQNGRQGIIYSYGVQGQFFDSPAAKSKW